VTRVAIYGNNLNQGYFLARSLHELGVRATLFCPSYEYAQERHDWWTASDIDGSLVRYAPLFPPGCGGTPSSDPEIRRVYDEIAAYDVLVMAENGPAVFSDLGGGPARVFLSLGFDLQNTPFLLKRHLYSRHTWQPLREVVVNTFSGHFGAPLLVPQRCRAVCGVLRSYATLQRRQRKGLRQADALVIAPHQEPLARRLSLDPGKVRYLPMPMDTRVLQEVDRTASDALARRYAAFENVFFHPTRQFFLRTTDDPYKKDNYKLLEGYADYRSRSTKRSRLLLVRKGDAADLEEADRIIHRLGLNESVEWLPEMPNRELRAFYTMRNVIVCDQFSPNLAVLGNIGREASFFGRLLITSFRAFNTRLYGADIPAHVLPAETAGEVARAMLAVDDLSDECRAGLEQGASRWFQRHHANAAAVPKWIRLFEDLVAQRSVRSAGRPSSRVT